MWQLLFYVTAVFVMTFCLIVYLAITDWEDEDEEEPYEDEGWK